MAQERTPVPAPNTLVGYGQPATTPSPLEMLDAWHTITRASDPFLEAITTAQLQAESALRSLHPT